MQSIRRVLCGLILVVSFAVLSPPAFAQQVIATVPVGGQPDSSAVNPVTNKIYVANYCGNDPSCRSNGIGTVTVIDGATNNTVSVNVGFAPVAVAVNAMTNKIYVANTCGNDASCNTHTGTVTVIDGATLATQNVTVGSSPQGVAVNSVTNKIYVVNGCGNDASCQTLSGTVTVIDGPTLATTTVVVGISPSIAVINPVTDRIYVTNYCGNDPIKCAWLPFSPGTVTVIDGVTNNPVSVNVGFAPYAEDVNTVTNQIYVANRCGNDPYCASTATVTVIDGASLATTDVTIGGYNPAAIAVNSTTNKIYVAGECNPAPSCEHGTVTVINGVTLGTVSVPAGVDPDSIAVNSVTNQIYVANRCWYDPTCRGKSRPQTVAVIDDATLAFANVGVGAGPFGLAVNSVTNRIYVPNGLDATVSVIDGTPPTALQFVPLSQPCRAVDTRPGSGGNGPIPGGTFQNFAISGEGGCATLPSAAVYSMNVTVVPTGALGYLTIWPAGRPQPVVSTLNSVDGRVKADAAIVPAGAGLAVSIYVTDTTNVIVDVNGYFAPPTGSTLAFYPLAPCRVADTRNSNFPQGLGPPSLSAGVERQFPILDATSCNIPSSAAAYSLNFTVVPSGTLGYLTVWPTGQNRPTVSTLNDILGNVIANAAIVVAGTGSEVSAFATNNTDLVIDINGYFAPAGTGGLSLYGVQPCRAFDTRHVGSGLPFTGILSPPVDVVDIGCAASSLAQAYVFNATVIPTTSLGYLTLWPDGENQPVVSTLNAADGSITNNMAIVPTTNGSVDAYASGITQLILDISSYFAP
jgi:DNA-binding beta-propeller fold protein YncE